jgi:hypothetical protein
MSNLVQAADNTLLRAKGAGRNRVVNMDYEKNIERAIAAGSSTPRLA